jgi:LysR family transcriptional regulator, cell division regulator
MDIADLKVFETVARLGGMNRGAAELNTVQSNVTARIRLMEEELGAPLFERHARGVTLTVAGQRLLPYATQMRRLMEEARRAFSDTGVPRGSLLLGSLDTTAALRLSSRLSAYIAAYPEVDLSLRTGTTCELTRAVLDYELEGAFVCGPVSHPDLEETPVFREELALLTAPTVRTVDELYRAPALRIVVLRAGCSYRQRLEEILRRRGATALRVLEFGTIEALIGCAAAGLGVTLLPRGMVEAAAGHHRVAVHALPEADAFADTVFIQRRNAFTSSALSTFLQSVCEPLLQAQAAE